MIKDSISLCGVQVPCYFVSPVDKFNSEWLALLRACDPARISGFCAHFSTVWAEKAEADCPVAAAPARAFFNYLDDAMHETMLSHSAYFPPYVRNYLCEAGVPYVKVHDLFNSHIRQLWLDKQIQIIQEAL